MGEKGWRTLVIRNANQISYSNDNIIINSDGGIDIPINQLQCVFLSSPASTISSAAITNLVKNNTSIILCDNKHKPVCQVMGLGMHNESSGNIIDQSNWNKEICDLVWQEIVKQKIQMQINLLHLLGIENNEKLEEYKCNVVLGDLTNREGQAARIYFKRLFGNKFKRHSEDNINYALNYTYTILLSEFNRIITSHGFHTSLGIKHHNRKNPFNLSCDIMEPFRPFADYLIFKNKDRALDWQFKKEIIEITNQNCFYRGKQFLLKDAMEQFTLDVLRKIENPKHQIGKVAFNE